MYLGKKSRRILIYWTSVTMYLTSSLVYQCHLGDCFYLFHCLLLQTLWYHLRKVWSCFLMRLFMYMVNSMGLTHFPAGYRWWLQSMTSFGRLIPPFVFFHVKSPLSRVVDFHLYHNPWAYELNACMAQCQMPFENQGILHLSETQIEKFYFLFWQELDKRFTPVCKHFHWIKIDKR